MRPPVRVLPGLEGLGASWTLDSPKAMARPQESNVIRLPLYRKVPVAGDLLMHEPHQHI